MRITISSLLAAVCLVGFAGTAMAEGDAVEGEKVYRKCKACHQVGPDAKNRVGPELNAIVGRVAGSVEGFKYSDVMMAKNAEGFAWSEEAIDAYLADPKGYLPGNKMSFAGLKKEEDRQNVIAYLKTFQ